MSIIRLFTVFLVLGISGATAVTARAETPYEVAIQYALEHLTSGIATVSVFKGTEVSVMPTRTWKSVSGHYCRQYELVISNPDSSPDQSDGIRCRDRDGIWKQVQGN
jgi:surface antigen